MRDIAILEYQGRLIVSVQFDLTDSMALQFQESVLDRIEKSRSRGLVIDISALEMMDSFIARVFMETAHMARMMHTETVLVGMRPEVALTLVQMGFHLKGVHTATDLERGILLLEELEAAAEREGLDDQAGEEA